jgi:DNA-binding NarL/FixJ family response regulator
VAAGLTGRELEVLRHVALGQFNAEIARALYLSEATVKSHVARLLAKLGLSNRVQAARFAYEHDLLGDREAR